MSMLFRLPKQLPPLNVLLEEIGRPTVLELARALDVHERTVRRWVAANDAPKSALLTLFWLTRWGMQWLDADLYNEAQLHFAMNSCQARQIRELKGRLNRVGRLGSFGSANDPAEGVELPRPGDPHPMFVQRRPVALDGRRLKATAAAPGVIQERQCAPPNGYRDFIRRKRRAA